MSDKSPVRLATILNSFNRLTLLREALSTLAGALADCPFEAAVVVFDAGSTDGSLEWLVEFQRAKPSVPVHVIQRGEAEEGSFSAGVNSGVRYSLNEFPDLHWLFLFETDNWVEGAAPLLAAVHLLESVPNLAAAGFTVRKRSGEEAGFGCRFPTSTQFVLGQQLTSLLRLDAPRIKEWHDTGGVRWATCDAVFTSPLVIRRGAWERVGELDSTRFPFCDTDVDWSWRARKQGWRMAVIETAGVVHDNHGVASEWSVGRIVNFHRARLRLLKKHKHVALLPVQLMLLLRHLCEMILLLVASIGLGHSRERIRKRWVLLKSVLCGYEW